MANRLLDRYLGIPVLYAASLINRRQKRPERLTRIGVLVSPTLGDALLNSAVLQDLRLRFPDAHIIYFAADTNAGVADLLPATDRVVRLKLTSPVQTIAAIRNCELDVLLDFTPWQRLTAFYTTLSGAKYRVGFRSERQHRHWNYDLIADHSRDVHELDNFRSLLRAFEVPTRSEPSLKLPRTPLPRFEAYAQVIVFHAWASGDRGVLREWPQEKWAALASRLAGFNTLFVVTGAPADRTKSEALCHKLKVNDLQSQVYEGKDGLRSLTALLQRTDLVVSVNTGIMHLAAILGAPTVALNGPTATHRWGPRGRRVAVVEPRGGGGFLHFGFEFEGNPTDCMQRISVEDVYHAARTLLSTHRHAAEEKLANEHQPI